MAVLPERLSWIELGYRGLAPDELSDRSCQARELSVGVPMGEQCA